MENILYTCVQILHNFGAVVVVGSPAAGWWLERKNLMASRLALFALLGWFIQGATGIGFALTSYSLKGAVPEVTGVALAALLVKIFGTVIGFTLAVLVRRKGSQWRLRSRILAWQTMLTASVAALVAAAFLRWYL